MMALFTEKLLDKARAELRAKNHAEIQKEAALNWGARAIAALERGFVTEAQDYFHEAIEHAAFASVEVLRTVIDELARHGLEM